MCAVVPGMLARNHGDAILFGSVSAMALVPKLAGYAKHASWRCGMPSRRLWWKTVLKFEKQPHTTGVSFAVA